MNKENSSIKGTLWGICFILIIELGLALLAVDFLWAGIALFILVASIQIGTFILVWYVLALLNRVNDRLKNLEKEKN